MLNRRVARRVAAGRAESQRVHWAAAAPAAEMARRTAVGEEAVPAGWRAVARAGELVVAVLAGWQAVARVGEPVLAVLAGWRAVARAGKVAGQAVLAAP